jgi:hypothetical protein
MRSQTLQTSEWLHRCYGAALERLEPEARRELLSAARKVEAAELELYDKLRRLLVYRTAA